MPGRQAEQLREMLGIKPKQSIVESVQSVTGFERVGCGKGCLAGSRGTSGERGW